MLLFKNNMSTLPVLNSNDSEKDEIIPFDGDDIRNPDDIETESDSDEDVDIINDGNHPTINDPSNTPPEVNSEPKSLSLPKDLFTHGRSKFSQFSKLVLILVHLSNLTSLYKNINQINLTGKHPSFYFGFLAMTTLLISLSSTFYHLMTIYHEFTLNKNTNTIYNFYGKTNDKIMDKIELIVIFCLYAGNISFWDGLRFFGSIAIASKLIKSINYIYNIDCEKNS